MPLPLLTPLPSPATPRTPAQGLGRAWWGRRPLAGARSSLGALDLPVPSFELPVSELSASAYLTGTRRPEGGHRVMTRTRAPPEAPACRGSAGPPPPPWPGPCVLTRAGTGVVSCRCTCLRSHPQASVGPWGPPHSSWQCLDRSLSTPSVRRARAGPSVCGRGAEGRGRARGGEGGNVPPENAGL